MSYVDYSHIPTPLRNKLELELRSGERIVWAAQPVAKRFARGSWPIVIFGVFWTAFSVFWVATAARGTWSNSTPGVFKLFPLFGLPFVLIGIGMLISPIWMRKRAAKTVYMITDQRAVIMSEAWPRRTHVQSYAPAQLQSVSREENPDGSGDLIFETHIWRGRDGSPRTQRLGFYAVPDVKAVEEHIRVLAQKATA